VVHEDVIHEDFESLLKHPLETRSTYSLFWQMSRMTRDKGALLHEDRLDAVAAACRHWVEALAQDEENERAKAQRERYKELMKDPLGNGRPVKGWAGMHGLAGPNGVLSATNKMQIGTNTRSTPNRIQIRGLR
jgi:hypothetical protein